MTDTYGKLKNARIKIKTCDKITIFDILVIKTLIDISDMLYLYVDDRTTDSSETQTMIDNFLNTLNQFGIKAPVTILRYSDYYNIAWVYLHRLVKKRKALLNYNETPKYSDLNTVMRNRHVKIFLYNDDSSGSDEENNTITSFVEKHNIEHVDRYDNILYDSWWFRDVFIETVIDDAENVTLSLPDDDPRDICSVKEKIRKSVVKYLNFTSPVIVLTSLIERIEEIHNTHKDNTEYILLTTSAPSELVNMGIDINIIKNMVEMNDISLSRYTLDLDTIADSVIIDTVKVELNEARIDDTKNLVKSVYVEKEESYPNIVQLCNLGTLKIIYDNNMYYGSWMARKKAKKAKNRKMVRWFDSDRCKIVKLVDNTCTIDVVLSQSVDLSFISFVRLYNNLYLKVSDSVYVNKSN